MKKMKRLFAFASAMALSFAMSTAVFAQQYPDNATKDTTKATITIENAAIGETYTIAKLFDASVTGTEGGSVRYTGDIPESLEAYYTKDAAGNITVAEGVTDATLASKEAQAALMAWAEANPVNGYSEVEMTGGDSLEFVNLEFGYYIVISSQGAGTVSVDTTNPSADVTDKNTTDPVGGLTKKVDDEDEIVSIGDTITYTVSFTTANYIGTEQIIKYNIEDTLPDFLDEVTVTSITVNNNDGTTPAVVTTQFDNKKIVLNWAIDGVNTYKNGATVTIEYTAKVTSKIVAGSVESNVNTVTVKPETANGPVDPDPTDPSKSTSTETIKTYAAAIQKVDENDNALAGATFQIPGLTVTGSKGNYTVVSYDPTSTAAGTTMECDQNGYLVIRGISNEDTMKAYEVAAPNGYNKLADADAKELTIAQTAEATTVTTTYYDEEGNEVETVTEAASTSSNIDTASVNKIENKKGSLLPSTGGIGTTIFYVVGGILVAAAAVLLITKKRMSKEV